MLFSLISGVGEVDLKEQEHFQEQNTHLVSSRSSQAPIAPDIESLPYLLLDVRTPDEFEHCHIIGGTVKTFP